MIRSNRNFRQALEEGFVPIGQTSTRLLSGESFDAAELLAVLEQEEEKRKGRGAQRANLVHPASDFDTRLWMEDLDADHDVLSEVLGRVAGITPDEDDKLQTFKRFMDRRNVKADKIIIFSEAEATVEYLYDQLNPGGTDASIARLSGANRDQAANIIKRFSPTWNLGPRERIPGPEVRVLIATDIVSEGQNLQDCARVLNYDLHWNPVKLVQRFGRVDRIGTTHSVIHLHNMWPDLDVDAGLALTDRLLNRIQKFHDFVGLDSRLLSESERLNTRAMYRIYQEKELPDIDEGFDEVAAHQRGVSLLQRLQEDDPELWQTITDLPDGIRSAMQVGTPTDIDVEADRFMQSALAIEGSQMPMMSPAAQTGAATPFDDPKPGETMVLLNNSVVRHTSVGAQRGGRFV